MGSRREVRVLQYNLEVGRNNDIALVLHCCPSLGPRELNCGPGKEEAKSARHKACPENCMGPFPPFMLKKLTPAFPSKSSKFLSLENYVYTLAVSASCGKWSLHEGWG